MYRVWFLGLLLAAFSAAAQENIAQSSDEIVAAPVVELKDDSFYNPQEELERIRIIERPACNDPALIQKVRSLVEGFLRKNDNNSTLDRRQKVLMMQNIKTFRQISAINFAPEIDFNVANALITLKINRKILPEDITLCQQEGKGNLYLIYYPYQDNYKVHVINLGQQNDNEGITFIYP